MALIKCSECNNEISDKAPACIHCGAPISKSTESKLMIRAENYPNNNITSFVLVVYNTKGEELATLHTGTSITIPVREEMEIYVKYKTSMVANKTISNTVRVVPDKTTRLQVSYQKGFWLTKLYLSEVDVIDSI